MLFSLKGKQ